MTHTVVSSFAIAAMLSFLAAAAVPVPGRANEVAMETLKIQSEAVELKGKAKAGSANAKLKTRKNTKCDQAATMTAIALAESGGRTQPCSN